MWPETPASAQRGLPICCQTPNTAPAANATIAEAPDIRASSVAPDRDSNRRLPLESIDLDQDSRVDQR